MQTGMDHASPNWLQIAFGLLAAFIGGGGTFKLLTFWLNRKKLPAEIHESLARTDKTRAEARKIHAEADVELNAIIERLHLRIDQMQAGIDEIRHDRDEWKERAESAESQNKIDEHFIKRLSAANELKITLAELDQKSLKEDSPRGG